ncbi:MAG: phage GP46 family protein [Desulfovibrio sp.]|jgi:phage gp46-like protein|nr:phage GP46 family protein [Desulfovibrio sp.]
MSQVQDIALYYKEWGVDAALQGPGGTSPDLDMAADDTLKTAVILSLFLDRRARDDDAIPDGTTDKRGWWADTIVPMTGDTLALRDGARSIRRPDQTGSRLWLLSRELQVQEVVRRAHDYAVEALNWLVEDGHAARVEVRAFIPRFQMLGLDIRIWPTGAGTSKDYSFAMPIGAYNAV